MSLMCIYCRVLCIFIYFFVFCANGISLSSPSYGHFDAVGWEVQRLGEYVEFFVRSGCYGSFDRRIFDFTINFYRAAYSPRSNWWLGRRVSCYLFNYSGPGVGRRGVSTLRSQITSFSTALSRLWGRQVTFRVKLVALWERETSNRGSRLDFM